MDTKSRAIYKKKQTNNLWMHRKLRADQRFAGWFTFGPLISSWFKRALVLLILRIVLVQFVTIAQARPIVIEVEVPSRLLFSTQII